MLNFNHMPIGFILSLNI